MKKIIILLILLFYGLSFAQTVDQKLLVIRNDGRLGGQLIVAYQVKGTSLTTANTLGSSTADILFNNTKLLFVKDTLWAFGLAQGYAAQATNNVTSVRIGITGSGVFPAGASGFDISAGYFTWVQLKFTILDTSAAPAFSIAPATNAIGLFQNHANNPQTNVINNQILSNPLISVRNTISGNTGVAGVSLNYNDGGLLNVVSGVTGAYSLDVPYGWTGTITPTLTGYTFAPVNVSFTNIIKDTTGLNFVPAALLTATVEQQLQVIRNDGVAGGEVSVLFQVKGTNLTAANTLGSATVDISFDTSKLSYSNSTNWGLGPAQGYNGQVTNNTTFLRIGVTSSGVFPNGGSAGVDLTSAYSTLVQLNFTIKNAASQPALSIISATNAIGLFQNHANNPQTNNIVNQALTTPVFVTAFVTVNTKIFLEGAYNSSTGLMNTLLSKIIPLTSDSAYSALSYGYTASTVSVLPANVVDWLLIELRNDSTTALSTVIKKQAAFILSNGSVVDTDGVSPVKFNSTFAGNYYLIIRHRNHLAVMSAAKIALTSTSPLYDFTTSPSQAYGTNALDTVSIGVYGSIAGDANGSGIVTLSDVLPIISKLNSNVYLPTDINMSGITTIADVAKIIEELNKSSKVPN